MATSSETGARASRRAAATAARNNVPVKPPVDDAPEVLADVMGDDDDDDGEADEAFGPEDVAPVSQTTTAVSAPVQPSSAQHGAVALPMAPLEDLTRKIDVGDVIMPKLRLVQAMSKTNMLYQTSRGKEGIQQGNWQHSTSGENLGETVYFIPVDMRKSRAYFVQGEGLSCRSFDLRNGEGNPGGPCEGTQEEMLTIPADRRGCPLRLWNDRTPPKCGITYNFPGLILRESDIEDPSKAKPLRGMLQLRSASTGAAKEIITKVMEEGNRVWHNVIIELGVDVKTNPRGTFYTPSVDLYDTTDAAGFERIQRQAASMARSMGNQNLRQSIEDDDTV